MQLRANRVKIYRVAIAAFMVAISSSLAHAQTDKYWVGSSVNPTPAGTWDTVTNNWNTLADGSGLPTTWTAGDRATFSAGAGATGSYVVALSATQSISGLTVDEGNPTFSTNSIFSTNPIFSTNHFQGRDLFSTNPFQGPLQGPVQGVAVRSACITPHLNADEGWIA
jgi:hypothetical protein